MNVVVERRGIAMGDASTKTTTLEPTSSFYVAIHAINQFAMFQTPAELIAQTKQSRVFKSYSALFGRFVAIKIIDKSSIPATLVEKFLPRELDITQKVDHVNVVKCLFVGIPHPTKVVIISEFCDGGTLLKYVLDKSGLDDFEAARLFRQLIEGIQYLHQILGVAHRDIKLENILLTLTGLLKLADFGFAREIHGSEKSVSYCGTRPYSALQLVDHIPYLPFSSDWFSCGIAFYTMVAGNWPYTPQDKIRYPLCFHPKIGNLAQILIGQLLEFDETKRAGYHECLNSEWLCFYIGLSTSVARPVTIVQNVSQAIPTACTQIVESVYYLADHQIKIFKFHKCEKDATGITNFEII